MKQGTICAFLCAFLLTATCAPAQESVTAQPAADPLHAWVAATSPAALESWVDQRLAAEQADLDKLLAVKGPRTIENTLRPYDDAQNELAIAGNNAYLLYSVADGATMRDKGQAMASKISSVSTDLSLNQEVYKALAAVPLPANDPATRHYLERTLLEYRLSGVDKDDATRKKLRALQDKITDLSLAFGRNVADGKLKITATRAELDGMPSDYIAQHKPDPDGVYTLTTDEPDARPVSNFATNPALRMRMYLAYYGRAYPKNVPVLNDLLVARQDLATTLGYPTYADLAAANQMMGTSSHIEALLQQLDEASHASAQREYAELLAFAQQRQPGLTEHLGCRRAFLERAVSPSEIRLRRPKRTALFSLQRSAGRDPEDRVAILPHSVQACVGCSDLESFRVRARCLRRSRAE